MAPLPVIEDVFRCVLNLGTVDGLSPVNVFHVGAAGKDVTEVADLLWESEVEFMLSPVPEAFEPVSWTVTPLDGVTASYTRPREVGAVTMCNGGTDEWIAEAAMVISIRTAVRGPRGRGRMFIGPLIEDAQSSGRIIGDGPEVVYDAWLEFGQNLAAELVFIGVASYVHADFNAGAGFSIDREMATQRRRLLATR